MKKTLNILLTALAITCALASPAFAQDVSASEASGVEIEDVLGRFAVGADVRGRAHIFDSHPMVTRTSIEFALVEPEAQEDGVRLDLFGGMGDAQGHYVDGGAQLGYEFAFGDHWVFTMVYGLSVSQEESLTEDGFLSSDVTLLNPVSLHHRLGFEFGLQNALRVRMGFGHNETLAHDTPDSELSNRIIGMFTADAGLVWRM